MKRRSKTGSLEIAAPTRGKVRIREWMSKIKRLDPSYKGDGFKAYS